MGEKKEKGPLALIKDTADKIMHAVRLDGWANVLTGLGMRERDKRLMSHVRWEPMHREDQEHLYAGDEMARKIVDMVPDEAMEKGYKIIGWQKPENEQLLTERLAQLRFDEVFNEAWKNDRMHGGAGVFMVCDDGQMDTPMPKRPIMALNIMHRWELFVWASEIETDITNPAFGTPRMYRLQLQEGDMMYTEPVHASRVVRFPGAYLPRYLRKMNNWWGDSELNRLKNAIRNYSTSHDAVAATIQDFSVPVTKIKDLAQLMQANEDQVIIKRLELMNLSRSIARMIVLDAENEDFDHKTRTVTGLAELLGKTEDRLVSATGFPGTKLFGRSPKGLGGEGGHEETNWYDFLKSGQTSYLKPRMLQVIRHIVATEPEFQGEDVTKMDIEFNPLWQMDDGELATMRKTQAETDAIYITNQVIDPDEVAKSRFGGPKYSVETQIDKDARDWKVPTE